MAIAHEIVEDRIIGVFSAERRNASMAHLKLYEWQMLNKTYLNIEPWNGRPVAGV